MTFYLSPDRIRIFWSRVKAGPSDQCWEWAGGKSNNRYGAFFVLCDGIRKSVGAHRVAAHIAHGPAAEGQHTLHSCDNPGCCNPSHLRYGSAVDNMADARIRGRAVPPPHVTGIKRPLCDILRGERIGTSVLTEAAVRRIYELHMGGNNVTKIADAVGFSKAAVSDVCQGKSWKHVAGTNGAPSLDDLKRGGVRRGRVN